jgi:hypothetical protein
MVVTRISICFLVGIVGGYVLGLETERFKSLTIRLAMDGLKARAIGIPRRLLR